MKTMLWLPGVVQQKGKSSFLTVIGAAAVFLMPISTAQQRSPQVIDAAAIQRILAKSSDPNPFSELTHGDGFRLTVRRRTQRDVANRHDSRVEVYHILDGSATLTTGASCALRAKMKEKVTGRERASTVERRRPYKKARWSSLSPVYPIGLMRSTAVSRIRQPGFTGNAHWTYRRAATPTNAGDEAVSRNLEQTSRVLVENLPNSSIIRR